jgi:multicomponent Na+:H+ antiporter subunit G
MIFEIVAIVIAALGTGLFLVAGLGLVRMPDLLNRMHASSKAGTLGAVLVLAAVAINLADTAITMRVALIIFFLFITAPVAAHMIARAAYRSGTPLSDETVIDEYQEACAERDRDSITQHRTSRGPSP